MQGDTAPNVLKGEAVELKSPPIAFLFTGQGSQYIGMGRALYETSPTFKGVLDHCDEILRSRLERPLLSVLYPKNGSPSPLDETACTQPALFAIEYALAELWKSWGIQPSFVMGHSVGEYAAACVAGVFSLEDGIKLIAERARLMQSLPAGGRMAAVFAGRDRVADAMAASNDVSFAAINGPEAVVISGNGSQVREVLNRLAKDGIKSKDLTVSHAFHSQLLEPVLGAFEKAAAGVAYSEPNTGYISNLTGLPADGRLIGKADYWRRHAREPVQFAAGVHSLVEQGARIFLEIGPSPVLLGMARRCVENGDQSWLPSLRSGRGDWVQILESLQILYISGAEIDWPGFDRDYSRTRLALPTYPFQRRRYWLDNTHRKDHGPRFDPERSWNSAKAAGLRQSQHSPLGVHVPAYAEIRRHLKRLTTVLAANTLRDLGAFSSAGETHDVESLIKDLGVPEMYRHLLHRWLIRLSAAGVLRRDNDKFVSDKPIADTELSPCLRKTELLLKDDPHLLSYLRNCSEKLTSIIGGKESPLETLFPGGSSQMAENLYEGANMNRYVNSIAGAVVEAASRSWSLERPMRILEVGGGTGGTSATLLPLLDAKRSAYVFTDVSDLFLTRAREKFAGFPFLRFSIFDIEKELEVQGFAPQTFDIVVGANVVHAARDLDGALKRIQTLLAPGGFLLLVEATQHQDWFDFTTGLIEGWQHFSDDLRGDNPLLSPDKWRSALLERGFAEVVAYPENGSPAMVLGQHVILARTVPDANTAKDSAGGLSVGHPSDDKVQSAVTTDTASCSAERVQEFRQRLEAALPDEREELMKEFVRSQVMGVLRLDSDRRPDLRHRLMDLGLDSLMAVQLRNLLESGLGLGRILPATLMFDYPTIDAISKYLLQTLDSNGVQGVPATHVERQSTGSTAKRAQEIEALSDDEVEARLLKRLERK